MTQIMEGKVGDVCTVPEPIPSLSKGDIGNGEGGVAGDLNRHQRLKGFIS